MSDKQYFWKISVFPNCVSWLKAGQHGFELVLFHAPRPLGVVTLNKDDISLFREHFHDALLKFADILRGANPSRVKIEFPGSKIAIAIEPWSVDKVAITLSLFNKPFTAIRNQVDGERFLEEIDGIIRNGDDLLAISRGNASASSIADASDITFVDMPLPVHAESSTNTDWAEFCVSFKAPYDKTRALLFADLCRSRSERKQAAAIFNGTDNIAFYFEDESVAEEFIDGLGLTDSDVEVNALKLYVDAATEIIGIAESSKPDWAIYSIIYQDDFLKYTDKSYQCPSSSNRDYYVSMSKRAFRWLDWCLAKLQGAKAIAVYGGASHVLLYFDGEPLLDMFLSRMSAHKDTANRYTFDPNDSAPIPRPKIQACAKVLSLPKPPWKVLLGTITTKPHVEAMIKTYGHENLKECPAPWQYPACASCLDSTCQYHGHPFPPSPDLYVADVPDAANRKTFGDRCLTTTKFLELLKETQAGVRAKQEPITQPRINERSVQPAQSAVRQMRRGLAPEPTPPVTPAIVSAKEVHLQEPDRFLGPSKLTFSDITDTVDRMESLESKLGVTFSGVMVTVQEAPDNFGEFMVKVMGEFMSLDPENGFQSAMEVRIVAYNVSGQVVGSTVIYISLDNEAGLEVFDEKIFCKGKPSRVRLMPKRM